MSETILLVDDTPANLEVLIETLGAAGYQLRVAEDGEEALAQTAHQVPDLILLDVRMPGIDGFETCRRLKARPATADVPVLFLTALGETADKVRAFAAGGVDHLTKPIEPEEALARVRTHLTLRRLGRQLSDEVAQRQRFMRFAGHDLRNPVCLILIAAELARETSGLPAAARERLDNIADSAAQIRRIIDTFLGLRMRGAESARSDLARVAGAVTRQHAPAAEHKSIALTCETGGDLPMAACDATFVYQALSNLLSNALKFTPAGGAVTVAVEREGEMLRVTVRDSGPGVPPVERGRLFTEDAQLSPRPTGGEESHGYGLAIVKQFIEAQGGRVGAEFPAGGGSLFWCALPAIPSDERRAADASCAPARPA